jgi:hypothetical protein
MDEPTEAELRAFVGPRADYYIAAWSGKSGKRKYNWAAFFMSGLWLPYRRMYRPAMLFLGVVLAVTIILDVVFIGLLAYPEVPAAVNGPLNFVPGIVCAMLGNEWYRAHVYRMVARTRALSLPDDAHLLQLEQRGQTRVWHSLGFFGVFAVAIAAVVVLEEILPGPLS